MPVEDSALDLAFLFIDWMGKPVWMWLTFIGLVIAILAFDLGVLHKENKEIEVNESLKLSASTSRSASPSVAGSGGISAPIPAWPT